MLQLTVVVDDSGVTLALFRVGFMSQLCFYFLTQEFTAALAL